MVLGFWPSDVVLVGVQSSLVAGPRMSAPLPPELFRRLRGSAWSSVIPLSLGFTVALLAVAPDAATFYTWLAVVAVPILAVPALRGLIPQRLAGPGGRTWVAAAGGVALLFGMAWAVPGLPGQGAAVAMTALSCATLAACLGQLAPVVTLKVGLVLMAILDSILVFGDLLQGPNDRLNSAAPSGGLPQLQFAEFGSAVLGYGDLFAAAVLGVVIASLVSSRSRGVRMSLVTMVCSLAFDGLFLVVSVLPATVPVAAALLLDELWKRRSANRSDQPFSVAATRTR